MDNSEIMLKSWHEQLVKKLNYLQTEKRQEYADKLKTARDYGDLSENAEYDIAKDNIDKLDVEIFQLDNVVRFATIIPDDEIDTSQVSVGCKVEVYEKQFDDTSIYSIVGPSFADPFKDAISYESPIGKALMGKKCGEEITYMAPSGKIDLKVTKIYK